MFRCDLYSYGRTREPVATMRVDAAPQLSFVCASCGCSATTADHRLLSTIGWQILPACSDDVDLPALCPPCARKVVPRR